MLIREVRARHEGGGELVLVLHAQLTVLTGLAPAGEVALADVLAAAIYGRTEGLGGQLELHGSAIDLAEWGPLVGEQLDHVDVFLRAADLPARNAAGVAPGAVAPGPAGRAREEVATARAKLAAAEQRLVEATEAVHAAEEAVEAARVDEPEAGDKSGVPEELHTAQADASLRLGEADVELARAEALLAAAETRRVEAAAALTKAEAGVTAAAEQRQRAEALAAEVEAAEETARQAQAAAADAARAASDALEATTPADADALAAVPAVDPDHPLVAEAVAAVSAAEAATAEAQRLADRLDAAAAELTGAVAANEAAEAARHDEVERARQQVDEIEGRLPDARADAARLAGVAEADQAAIGEPVDDTSLLTPEAAAAAAQAEEAASFAHDADAQVTAHREEAARHRTDATEVADRRAALLTRRADISARLDDLDERASALLATPAGLAERVDAAADRLRNLPSADRIESAARLLVEVDALISSRAQFSDRAAPLWLVDNARQALEDARLELARAEEMARPLQIGPEEMADLEAAHEAVAAAEERVGRRLSPPGSRRRLDAALAHQKEVLDGLGIPSFGTYLLRTVPLASDSEAAEKLIDARKSLADAEAVWNELRGAEYADERARLEEEEAHVLAEALAVIGPDRVVAVDEATPAATLVSTRDALEEVALSGGRVAELTGTLAELVPGTEEGGEAALAQADRWLDAVREDAARREVMAIERDELVAELEAVESGLVSVEPGSDHEAAEAAEAALAAAEREAVAAWARADAAAQVAAQLATDARSTQAQHLEAAAAARADAVAAAERSAAEAAAARDEMARLEAQLVEARAALAAVATADAAGSDTRIAELQAAVDRGTAGLAEARTEVARTAELAEAAVGRLAAHEEQLAAEAGAADAEARAQATARLAAESRAADEVHAAAQAAVAERAAAAAAEPLDAAVAAQRTSDEALHAARGELADAAAARVEADRDAAAAQSARAAAAEALTSAQDDLEEAIRADTARRRAGEDATRVRLEHEAEAARAVAAARATAAGAAAEVGAARGLIDEAESEQGRLESAGPPPGDDAVPASPEDAEIYVLSRFATARSVGKFGAVPLILVDPLVDLGREEAAPVLDLVARMTAAVQVVYLTEDPTVIRWAADLGPDRATVLRFSPDAGSRL